MTHSKNQTSKVPLSTLLIVISVSMAAGFAIVYLKLVGAGNDLNAVSQTKTQKTATAKNAPGSAIPPSSPSPSGQSNALAGMNRGELSAFLIHKKPVALPAFSFSDLEGKSHSLTDWKGKVVLLNLWATWCAPCRKEMPDMDRLQGELGGDDFELVPLNVDHGGLQKPKKFFEQLGIKHLKLYGGKNSVKLTSKLRAPGLPTTILINREGFEIGRLVGPAHWGSQDAVNLIKAAINAK